MEFACFVATHNNLALAEDTLDSFEFWANTKKAFILVDGAYWALFENAISSFEILKGLRHGFPKSPYRNISFGLMELYKRYPTGVDFYVYIEQDVLFIGDQFKEDLKSFPSMSGFDMRPSDYSHKPATLNLDVLDEIVGERVENDIYLLGCTLFFHKRIIKKLIDEEILDKIIKVSDQWEAGFFPNFKSYAVEESLFSSLAEHYYPHTIKHLKPFSRYACRWTPEIRQEELSAGTSIIHPLKNVKDPIRVYYRKFRNRAREF